MSEEVDRRLLSVAGAFAALLLVCGLLADQLHLKWLQEVEWPTDLYGASLLPDEGPPDVGVVGSSRAHFALPPSALDACLGDALGRPTRTVAANRMRASAYTIDITARNVFSGARAPRVLVVEAAPESLNAHHFELDGSVHDNADVRDVPECLAAAFGEGEPAAASCLHPFVRAPANLAFLLHRPLTEHAHLTWMARYHGGGQYCYDDDACLARNRAYDLESAARWEERVSTVLPTLAAERFRAYTIGGLPAAHFEALLARAREEDQRVIVVNLPVHALYQARIPAAAYAAYDAWVRARTAELGAVYLDLNTPEWQADRERFLDPDHLDSDGALALSREVCAEVARAFH